jgi:hypothetical protein
MSGQRRRCYGCGTKTPHDWYTNGRGERVHECQVCHRANAIETEDYSQRRGRHDEPGAMLRRSARSAA